MGNCCPFIRQEAVEGYGLVTHDDHEPVEMTPTPLPVADALGNVTIEGINCSRMGFSICKHCGALYLDAIQKAG